ncbi:unnamed protein product [Rotaria sp. Silwood1]|nr:unnamed protein product [Rotaria sp. Silwood1]
MVRCNLDNVTCSIPQTICVSGTRCQQPACYPMPLANIQICPPSTQSIILVASSTRVPNTTAAWNATTTSVARATNSTASARVTTPITTSM